MEIPVRGIEALRFNFEFIQEGVAVKYKYAVNEHYFLALIAEAGPNMLKITNGFVDRTIDLEEVVQEVCEIIPLGMPEDGRIIEQAMVFDTAQIPIGSIFVDADGLSFMVTEVYPFYITITGSDGERADIQAEVFFALDQDEQQECKIVLPPLFIEALKEQAVAYQENI